MAEAFLCELQYLRFCLRRMFAFIFLEEFSIKIPPLVVFFFFFCHMVITFWVGDILHCSLRQVK